MREGAEILKERKIAVVGMGLMGGSLAMALKGKCGALYGVDPNPESVRFAREQKIVEMISSDVDEILALADTIVLAAPVNAIVEMIPQLPKWHQNEALVLDLGSTKRGICKAMERLPERFKAVGGHPMCGKALGGISQAEADLYKGAVFALVACGRTDPTARAVSEALVSAVGAKALWVSAEDHDRWVAATSHLPFLLANTLAGVTPADAAALIGPGWRSTTRLATTPLEMMTPVLQSNRDEVLQALRLFKDQLNALERAMVNDNFDELEDYLMAGAARQQEMAGGL